ncbi:hypothetical protein AOQ84DRAFT_358662 [Glonium stellatum]|uniref:RRM domain-containing protein n=1 Tax=Glonium stellatum TaxID=574774 RepID=A0A8E2JZC5_9PEZI|nr:hypothetical protein AOQ84DRAFT_358662 [Glonium stellatum]
MERVRNLLADHFDERDNGASIKSLDAPATTQLPDVNFRETSFPPPILRNPHSSTETPSIADHSNTNINTKPSKGARGCDSDIAKATRLAMAEGRRLFVGNLSLRTRDNDLRAFFGSTKVESIIIPRSLEKGQLGHYGFVTTTTAAHAENAISELNNQLLCDRPIYIRLCKKNLNSKTDSNRPTKRRASEGPSEESDFSPHKKAKTEDSRHRRLSESDCYTSFEHLKTANDSNPPVIEFEDISDEVERRLKMSELRRWRQSQLPEGTRKRKWGELDDNESEENPQGREGRLTPPPAMSPPPKKQKQSAPPEKRKAPDTKYDMADIPKDASPRNAKLRKAELVCQDGKWIFA